jgi:hypothetical protein
VRGLPASTTRCAGTEGYTPDDLASLHRDHEAAEAALGQGNEPETAAPTPQPSSETVRGGVLLAVIRLRSYAAVPRVAIQDERRPDGVRPNAERVWGVGEQIRDRQRGRGHSRSSVAPTLTIRRTCVVPPWALERWSCRPRTQASSALGSGGRRSVLGRPERDPARPVSPRPARRRPIESPTSIPRCWVRRVGARDRCGGSDPGSIATHPHLVVCYR